MGNNIEEALMPDGREPIAVKVLENIDAIAPSEWDACAGTDNPFV